MIKMSEENEEFFDAVESLDNETKTANDKIEPVEERWDRMMVQSVVLADLLQLFFRLILNIPYVMQTLKRSMEICHLKTVVFQTLNQFWEALL